MSQVINTIISQASKLAPTGYQFKNITFKHEDGVLTFTVEKKTYEVEMTEEQLESGRLRWRFIKKALTGSPAPKKTKPSVKPVAQAAKPEPVPALEPVAESTPVALDDIFGGPDVKTEARPAAETDYSFGYSMGNQSSKPKMEVKRSSMFD